MTGVFIMNDITKSAMPAARARSAFLRSYTSPVAIFRPPRPAKKSPIMVIMTLNIPPSIPAGSIEHDKEKKHNQYNTNNKNINPNKLNKPPLIYFIIYHKQLC